MFALSPDIFEHAVKGFAVYRNPARTIDPVLRELGQTRAGWVKGSQFVFSQHCKSLRGLGVSEALGALMASAVHSAPQAAFLAVAVNRVTQFLAAALFAPVLEFGAPLNKVSANP